MAALVGDVSFVEVKRLAEKYFGDIPRGTEPPRMVDNEPRQNAERRVTVWFDAEPEILVGFKTPGRELRDNIVLEMIALVLNAGDSARLNRDLVQRRQIAFSAGATANALGERYGSLFMLQGAPRHPHTVAELEKEFYDHLDKLKTEPVGEADLRRALNQAEAGLYNGLDRNMFLAMRILGNAHIHNDVDAEFKRVEALKSVSAAEIMAAAKKYFIETNRTVGILQRKAEGGVK